MTELVPKAFENRARRCFPPKVTCTNWRSVLLARGAGGRFDGSVNCGPQPQVPTQCSAAAAAPGWSQLRLSATAKAVRQALLEQSSEISFRQMFNFLPMLF